MPRLTPRFSAAPPLRRRPPVPARTRAPSTAHTRPRGPLPAPPQQSGHYSRAAAAAPPASALPMSSLLSREELQSLLPRVGQLEVHDRALEVLQQLSGSHHARAVRRHARARRRHRAGGGGARDESLLHERGRTGHGALHVSLAPAAHASRLPSAAVGQTAPRLFLRLALRSPGLSSSGLTL